MEVVVVESLHRIGRSPSDVDAVVLTHGHPDHIGSAEHLRTTYGIPVWAHELEAANARGERIEQVSELRLLSMLWRPAVFAWLGDILRLKAARVERVLLAGDALMTEHALVPSPGPQLLPDFFNTDTARARSSLERLRGLEAGVVVPGHGPAFQGSPDDAVDQALRRSSGA